MGPKQHAPMNLQDGQGAIQPAHLFSHFIWHPNAVHLCGKLRYTVRGRNLHFLVPYFAAGFLPENLLQARDENIWEAIFAPPFAVHIDEVLSQEPEWIDSSKGLGRPLPIAIPFSGKYDVLQWILIEGDDGTALHPYSDFQFITPASYNDEWHLVFGKQAYSLEFNSTCDRDALKNSLIQLLPDPKSSTPDFSQWTNIFSVFEKTDALSPRFKATRIRRIHPSEVDTSRRSEMDGPCVRSELPTRFDIASDLGGISR
jgi:hypothetical protein